MNENKKGKYIKYAIGEIVLVVIGILIALQINNWNDSRKSKAQSIIYLSEMRKDLVSDTIVLHRNIKLIEESLDIQEWALSKTSYFVSDLDSLFLVSPATYEFEINSRTFLKIQNSDNPNLEGFDSLNDDISEYYTVTQRFINRVKEYEIKNNDNLIKNDLKSNQSIEIDVTYMRDYKGEQVEKRFPLKYDELAQQQLLLQSYNTLETRNQIRQIYSTDLFLLRVYKNCVSDVENLLMKINNALENN